MNSERSDAAMMWLSLRLCGKWMKCIIIVMPHSCVITLLSWNRLSCPTLFTDDYLIGIQFHTVESSKTPIMHHCLIKLAFFFLHSWNPVTKPPFSRFLHATSPLTHNCIMGCITLSRFNSQPAAYKLWNKDRSVCEILWFLGLACRQQRGVGDYSLDRLEHIGSPCTNVSSVNTSFVWRAHLHLCIFSRSSLSWASCDSQHKEVITTCNFNYWSLKT